jgi:hypothetical protein
MSAFTANGANWSETTPIHRSRPAPGIIAALFCDYLCVGVPLPVIPPNNPSSLKTEAIHAA